MGPFQLNGVHWAICMQCMDAASLVYDSRKLTPPFLSVGFQLPEWDASDGVVILTNLTVMSVFLFSLRMEKDADE